MSVSKDGELPAIKIASPKDSVHFLSINKTIDAH